MHDVAGRVPSSVNGHGRLNLAWLLVKKVSLHDIRAGNVQHARVLDPRYRLELILHPRNDLSNTAAAAGHGHVDCDHRSALGYPVTFEDADAELFYPQPPYFLGQLLRSGHYI